MRTDRALALALVLPACAGPAGAPGAGAPLDTAAAEAACATATAAHVGRPAAAVAAAWAGSTPDGGGTAMVTDAAGTGAERTHVCTLRPDGSVASLAHPGA